MMPNPEKIRLLLEKTGYQIIQQNGQRIYAFPGETQRPLKGSEIFVGKLPTDIFEDELVPFFERIGPIFDVRLMLNFTGCNRGYCFVRYRSRKDADLAVKRLNNAVIRDHKKIGVYKSLDNTRLFIGGIPTYKNRDEVWTALDACMDGIRDVIMYASYDDPSKNRGFAFVEFDHHRTAAIARRHFPPGSLKLWGVSIKVDWADPLPDPDPNVMAQVITLYVRNLPVNMSPTEFKSTIFKLIKPNKITKIHKTLDYAFLHFIDRRTAEHYLTFLDGLSIKGQNIEVAWARPDIYSKTFAKLDTPKHFCMSLPSNSRRQILMRKSIERENSSSIHSGFSHSSSNNGGSSPITGSPPSENDIIDDVCNDYHPFTTKGFTFF